MFTNSIFKSNLNKIIPISVNNLLYKGKKKMLFRCEVEKVSVAMVTHKQKHIYIFWPTDFLCRGKILRSML